MARILLFTDNHFSQYSSIIISRGDKFSTRLENQIQSLNWVNETAIEKNCKRLDELGLKANISYTISPKEKSTTSKPKYERKENFSNLEDFIKALYKDIF